MAMAAAAGIEADGKCYGTVVALPAKKPLPELIHGDIGRIGLHFKGPWMASIATKLATMLPMGKNHRGNPMGIGFKVHGDIAELVFRGRHGGHKYHGE